MKELGESSVLSMHNSLDKDQQVIPLEIGFYLILCKFNYGGLNL